MGSDAQRDDVEAEVIAIVAKFLRARPEGFRWETDLKVDYGVDSLKGLQIVAAVERRFGVRVPPEEIDCYTTIGTIVDAIKRHRAGAPPAPSRSP